MINAYAELPGKKDLKTKSIRTSQSGKIAILKLIAAELERFMIDNNEAYAAFKKKNYSAAIHAYNKNVPQ